MSSEIQSQAAQMHATQSHATQSQATQSHANEMQDTRLHDPQAREAAIAGLSPEHGKRVRTILEAAGDVFPYTPHFRRFRGALGAYIDEGPRDAPVLLCVHGNPTWSFFYRRLVAEFSGSMRVVVPDHIGMGLSEKPKDFDYRLDTRIAALEDLSEALQLDNIHLVAHDWGGAIGLGFAGRHAEEMRSLTLSNTAAFPGLPAHALIRIARMPGMNAFLMGRLGLFERITVKRACENPLSDQAKAAYLAPFPSPEQRVAVRAFVRDIPLKPSHVSYPALLAVEAGLQNLQDLPALLLWGEKDWVFTPAFREQFEARLPCATSVPLEDVGHLLWEDQPEVCLEHLREFLVQAQEELKAVEGKTVEGIAGEGKAEEGIPAP